MDCTEHDYCKVSYNDYILFDTKMNLYYRQEAAAAYHQLCMYIMYSLTAEFRTDV